jgi:hypothetical protein
MWLSMVMNGAVLSLVIVIVYIVALMYYCDGAILQEGLKSVKYFGIIIRGARTSSPRPMKELLVLGGMWLSLVMNGAVPSLVIVIVYIVALMYYCDGATLQEDL